MDYHKCINRIRTARCKKIIVTGPQRSGTTIAAHMLAHDLGYKYIDEADFKINEFDKFKKLLNKHKSAGAVVQCPALSHKCHLLNEYNDLMVVFMLRDTDDIIASESRIKWVEKLDKGAEAKKYVEDNNLEQFVKIGIPISIIKYRAWNIYQKQRVKNFCELEYESLQDHDMWIDKPDRKEFKSRQWEANK